MTLLASIQYPDQEPQRISCGGSPVRIGRNPLNEIYIDHPMVSHWHAVVTIDASNQVSVSDVGSTNGTLFNGNAVVARQPFFLGPKDVLSFGPVHVRLCYSDVAIEPAMAPGAVVGGTMVGSAPLPELRTMFAPGGRVPAQTMHMHASQMAPDVQAVLSSLNRTRPAYDAFEAAWKEVARQLESCLTGANPETQRFIAQALMGDLPLLKGMPGWATLLSEHGLTDILDKETIDVVEWVGRVKHLDPDAPPQRVTSVVALQRVGMLLETFADSFAALHRGWTQFGDEMGLHLNHSQSHLGAAPDGPAVLAVLLDWSVDGNRGVQLLKRAFADLAIHQVAVIHGVVEGVRTILEDTSPQSIESGRTPNGIRKRGILDFISVFRKSHLWSTYQGVHDALIDEDAFTRQIFGKAFARAYYEMSGQKAEEP